jgi:putative membrane protein
VGRPFIVLLTKLAINALALVVADQMFARIWFEDLPAAIAAAVVLALVNTYLRPLLLALTLPVNILTLGLFTLVVNAGLLKLVSGLIAGFHLEGFWTAVGAALVVSLISFLLNGFLNPPQVRVQVRRF